MVSKPSFDPRTRGLWPKRTISTSGGRGLLQMESEPSFDLGTRGLWPKRTISTSGGRGLLQMESEPSFDPGTRGLWNRTFLIRVRKLLPSRRVLKP